MAIKRFDAQPEPEQKAQAPVKSMFTPFQEKEDLRRSALGERVYQQGQDTQGALEEAQEEFKAAIGDIERAMPVVQELLQLYARMSSMPSPITLKAFTAKVDEVISQTGEVRAVLTLSLSLISYLQNRLGNG